MKLLSTYRSDPAWPPKVDIDWLSAGHKRVVPGETSPRDQKAGHIKVGFETMLPRQMQGLGPDETKGGAHGR